MTHELRPAADFSAENLAGLFCAAFADYFVPLHVDAAAIGNMVRRDSVDLARSRIALRDGVPEGFLLLALRRFDQSAGQAGSGLTPQPFDQSAAQAGTGPASPRHAARIAAMGVVPSARRLGVARRLLADALQTARQADCGELFLEVITANDPAVKLYESAGFRRLNTLLGFTHADTGRPTATIATGALSAESGAAAPLLKPSDEARVADWIARHGTPGLPWQLDAATIRAGLPGCVAFEWDDQAACLISDPTQERIRILSLVVHRERRRRGVGRAVLQALFRTYPGRIWRVPEIVPKGEGTAFLARLGWEASAIQQFLMGVRL